MKRLAAICWMITATLAVTMVFQISSEVQKLHAELRTLERGTAIHDEAVRVLQAEWSYLNRPAQIADLAKRHLKMRPITAAQFIEFADLPSRFDIDTETSPKARPKTPPGLHKGMVRRQTSEATLVSTGQMQ